VVLFPTRNVGGGESRVQEFQADGLRLVQVAALEPVLGFLREISLGVP